jgi:hypothetical protein
MHASENEREPRRDHYEKTSARVLVDGDPDNVSATFAESTITILIHVDPILLDAGS